VSQRSWLRWRQDQPERRACPWFLRPAPPGPADTPAAGDRLAHGSVLSGSGCGYRDRDRRDSMSELAMDWPLPSSGISSSPAR
jgi:hypothetical protein